MSSDRQNQLMNLSQSVLIQNYRQQPAVMERGRGVEVPRPRKPRLDVAVPYGDGALQFQLDEGAADVGGDGELLEDVA